jgi:hypothetical protein
MTLPGLSGFYFVGVWASMAGSLFGNVLSAKGHPGALQARAQEIPDSKWGRPC